MKNWLTIIFISVLSIPCLNLLSQVQIEKEKALSEANKLYENGLVDNIPSMLNPFIKKGFSRNEKKTGVQINTSCLFVR